MERKFLLTPTLYIALMLHIVWHKLSFEIVLFVSCHALPCAFSLLFGLLLWDQINRYNGTHLEKDATFISSFIVVCTLRYTIQCMQYTAVYYTVCTVYTRIVNTCDLRTMHLAVQSNNNTITTLFLAVPVIFCDGSLTRSKSIQYFNLAAEYIKVLALC